MPDREPRLGDVIEDYCPKCRLLLNHDVTSLAGAAAAKVTCRTCFNTHDFRHGQVPPKRKRANAETKKLVEQVMAGFPMPPAAPAVPPPEIAPRKKRDLWAEMERIKSEQKK
jgi:hypothetical protein